ncbi:MAG TPA: NDP-sugar synthase [Acidimicrobiia bacterium]|nr:NDP-sugar synthase [Acidimicrobiia bacterium]
MKAVVLVGGEGTRLRPLTYTTPKPLLPIANVPFLVRQLAWLERHGVDEAVLSLGYLPDAFEAAFPSGRCGHVRLRYAVEEQPLGTAGAIRFAAETIDEPFLVCNGDVLTDLDVRAMVEFHERNRAHATIALAPVDDPSAFGVVPTTATGQVIAFVEKPPPGKAPSNWINAGTYVLEPSFLERIPPRLQVSIERETFPRLLEQEHGAVFGYQNDSYWLDIGTPEKYLQAHADLLAGHLDRVPAPGAHQREPGIWVQGDVDIAPDAQMVGPVLLGAGSRLGAGALLRRAVLGAGATIGARAVVDGAVVHEGASVGDDATVTRSVLGARARVDAGASVSDASLVGADAHVAAGTRLAAARLPTDPVRPTGEVHA